MHQNAPIIVIGSGLAAYSLVREFRKLDQESAVLLITQDDGHSYSKPMLSTGFTKQKTADELSIADPGKMSEQLKASIRTFTQVTGIDPDKRQISIGNEVLPYKKLILALGAHVNRLNFPGSDHPKVQSINDLMDYRRFRGQLRDDQHVLIMGAGLIGCEYANDLLNGGYQVSVVDPASTPMQGLIPNAAGEALKTGLEKAGTQFHLNHFVQHIEELADGTLCATLNNGHKIPCDLVLSAIGLRPNIELANVAGLECNRGIVTNAALQTSNEHIYALGDCAETLGEVRLYVLPLMASARALAKTLAGTPTPVEFGVMPVATKTPACPVIVVPPSQNSQGEWEIEHKEDGLVCRFKDGQGLLKGFALTGNTGSLKMELIKALS